MKKALIVFGSKKDEQTYGPIQETMQAINWDSELQILSAHRQLEKLRERLFHEDFACVIAGAGLAAHLPGVCSAITHKPVYGVPVVNQWGGLDSLYSILQMPKGIPVLTTSLAMPEKNFHLLSRWFEPYAGVSLIAKNEDLKLAHSWSQKMENFPFPILINEARDDFFKLELVNLDSSEPMLLETSLKIPVWNRPTEIDWTKAQSLYEKIWEQGLWVGVNNLENALLAFLRHQNINKRYESFLQSWKAYKRSPSNQEVIL